MLKDMEDLQNHKLQLVQIQENLQNDYNGLKKKGEENMRLLDSMKEEMHRKIDICHMLTMEIRQAEVDVTNTEELIQDQHEKKIHLNERTISQHQTLETERDDLKLIQNEAHKARQALVDKKEEYMDAVVEDRMLEDKCN